MSSTTGAAAGPGPTGPLSRRGFLAAGAGVGAGLALTSCGGGGGGGGGQAASGGNGGKEYKGPKVELAFWNGFTGGDGPFMRDLTKKFSDENDNIDVKMTTVEWADYYQKVPSAVASGKGPDVGIMHVDQLATNAARNVVLPLDDVAKSLDLQKEDFLPQVWDAGEYKGKRYGIPLDVHPLGFYYNKTVMQKAGLDPNKPPQTADEYGAALEKLKAKGIQGHWATPFPFTGVLGFQALLWQFGGELFNEDVTEATFNSDAGVQALTWWSDLVKKGYSPKNVAQDADSIAFQNNKNAFIWNGIWAINTYNPIKTLEWGVAPLPQIGTEKAAWAGSHNFVIMRQRKVDNNKVQAAKVFINYISQQSVQWAKAGQVPARNSVRESSEFTALPLQAQFAKQVDYLHFAPPRPGIGDAMATLDQAVNEATLLKRSPKEALDAAAGRAKKLLADNAKKYGA